MGTGVAITVQPILLVRVRIYGAGEMAGWALLQLFGKLWESECPAQTFLKQQTLQDFGWKMSMAMVVMILCG